jgi:hypothetical protein
MSDFSQFVEDAAAAFAVVGGIYGAYRFARRLVISRPFKKSLPMFAGTNEVHNTLKELQGKTLDFDTVLDFSIGGEISQRISSESPYGGLLNGDASKLNGERLPLYTITDYGTLDSFTFLVVRLRDMGRLKFSHGGTGITQVLLRGRFAVEVRAYSGPSIEITLQEVD